MELWDLAADHPVVSVTDPAGFESVKFSADGAFLGAIAGSTDDLHLWETGSRQELPAIPGVASFEFVQPPSTAGPAPRPLVLARSATQRYTLWNLAGQRLVDPVPPAGLLLGAKGVVPNPDLTVLAVPGVEPDRDVTILFYNAVTGTEDAGIPARPVGSILFSPDWSIVALSDTGRVTLFDTRTASPVGAFRYYDPGHGAGGSDNSVIEFSPDGRTLATHASGEEVVRIWDAHTGRLVRTCAGHSGPVYRFVYSGDGHTVVTAGSDNTLRLWDVP